MSGINKAGSGGGGGGGACGSYIVAGRLEVATLAETLDGTYLGGDGCPLAVNPINQKIREETATGAIFANFATGTTLVSGFGTDAVELQAQRSGAGYLASGYHGIAIGQNNTASAGNAIAIGDSNVVAGGGSAVAIGNGNTAAGADSVAIGRGGSAGGDDAVVIGYGTADYRAGIAIGVSAIAGAAYGISIGGSSDAAGLGAVALGYNAYAGGQESVSAGYQAESEGYRAIAVGYDAKARIDNSVNLAGPILIRKDDGEGIAEAVRAFSGAEVQIMTDEIDLTAVADHTITLPAAAHFWVTEVGIILTEVTGALTTQPTVRFGITGTPAKFVVASVTTLLTAALKRERFDALITDDGETTLLFGVTVGATVATSMTGRAYFKGIWIEDL